MSLQELRQTITGTDGDERSLQSSVNGTKKKKTLSLPDDVHQHEEFRASRSVMVSSHDVMLNRQEDLGRGQRSRKPTSKVLEHKISLLKERREKTYSRLARKCNAAEDLLYSSKNKVAAEEEMLQINDLTKLLMSLHDECNELLGEEDRAESDEWLDMVDEHIFNFKTKVHRWLKCAEEEQQRYALLEKSQSSKRSYSKGSHHSSKSNASRKSSRSSKSGDSKTRAMEEKAKLAELLAEESFLMKRQIAENEAERLKVQEMVAKAKARAKVFEESESGDGKLFPQTKEARPNKQTDIDHYLQRGSHQKQILDEHLPPRKTDIVEVLCNLVKQQSVPDVDLVVFDGNPFEYHYFMTLFHELVEKRIEDPRGRLTRLIKHTKGDPKEMIKHCVQQPAAVGHDNAKKTVGTKVW